MRCFEDNDVIHVEGKVDPLSDIDVIETELLLADIQTLENAIPKAQRAARGGDKDAKLRLTASERCKEHLETGTPLRTMEMSEPEEKSIRSYGLMSAKPILYIANVGEDDLDGESPHVAAVKEHAEKVGANVVCVCAKFEAELAELDEEGRQEMLSEAGLREPALAAVARQAYRTLGLQSYFTAGEKEVRAWTIPIGASAPQAAGVIHSDFESNFIRAEVYTVEDLQTYEEEKAIRAAGKLRAEGKQYIVQDGDICHFL
ncbi:MAG: redox-regulated ATPase YchF [Planctomycetota bacterium]